MNKTKYISTSAIIAALYIVLTMVSNALGLASGAVQIRISEALCILPVFTPAAVPGLFAGCIISNIIAGGNIFDIIFGSLATLIGAIGTLKLKNHKYLALIPPIVSNTIIVPIILCYAYGINQALYFVMFTVGIGEVISCGVLGMVLLKAMEKYKFKA